MGLRVSKENPALRYRVLAITLAISVGGLFASAQSPDASGAAPQAGPAPSPCTINCPQAPAKPQDPNADVPAKPSKKPHKVLTNDDIDARPHDITMGEARDLLQQLNSCDRACFDQVAQRAGVYASTPRWKLVLLEAVETVKGDSAWQSNLGVIIGIQNLACETQARKAEDLRRYADSRNVTPNELAVERQYEPKLREIHSLLNAALDKANAHITKTAPGVLQSQYMHLQVEKIVQATCTINIPAPPEDTDDPADP
jgi:hypothetical protein